MIGTLKNISFTILFLISIVAIVILGLIAWKSLFWLKVFIYTILGSFLVGLFIRFFVVFLGDYQRAIIFRLGKFARVGGPGWTLRVPWIEEVFKIVDVRVQTLSLPEIKAFTKNDIWLGLDVVSFFRVEDAYRATLKVQRYEEALVKRLVGQVRNDIGSMLLRQVFAKLDLLNKKLREEVNDIVERWGLLVERVEIVQVELPDEVVEALYKPLTAEQKLLATQFTAEARKIVIDALGDAAQKLGDKGITVLYLKALEKMAEGKATKIVFPLVFTKFLSEYSDALKGWSRRDIEKAVKRIVSGMQSKVG